MMQERQKKILVLYNHSAVNCESSLSSQKHYKEDNQLGKLGY